MNIRSCNIDTVILADHLSVIGSIAIPSFKYFCHTGDISTTKLDSEQLYEKIHETENLQVVVLTIHNLGGAFDDFTTAM